MAQDQRVALGLDFGTESVRALLVGLDGREHGSSVARYRHGQITTTLPTSRETLPADFALQHPWDWIDASAKAIRHALSAAQIDAKRVISVGVDFTSCTMLPSTADGTPLCCVPEFEKEKYAWPKLWKHHAAQRQTDRINEVARRRKEPWLARYGGTVGLEWFFPKILETLDHAPKVYRATDVWLEAGDWYVWQLVGGPANELPRSTCQAGYKAMWNAELGYPSEDYFAELNPRMRDVVRSKMPGRLLSPGERAGELTPPMAKKLGLSAGIPVSAAVIDAHAGVPGSGASEPDTLVMVLGTSSCHMLNSKVERLVPGIAGVVAGGILPGLYGYETGQAAVGDAFDWFRRLLGAKNFDKLNEAAGAVEPGADGVLCLDWFNGCRTPLMDGSLKGAFTGLALRHDAPQLYRAMLEASAFGLRWIVELFQEGGVPVKRFVATGGLSHRNPLLVQVYADVLGQPIRVASTEQGPALGAAILGVLAAGKSCSGFANATAAIRAMTGSADNRKANDARIVVPARGRSKLYNKRYAEYRRLADEMARLNSTG